MVICLSDVQICIRPIRFHCHSLSLASAPLKLRPYGAIQICLLLLYSKIQIVIAFLVPAHQGSPGQRAVKQVCVCVYVGARADVVCLTYVYMLEFVLDDGSGWLSAGLWKDEAVSVPVRVIFI